MDLSQTELKLDADLMIGSAESPVHRLEETRLYFVEAEFERYGESPVV